MQFFDTLSPSCLRVCVCVSSVHCSLEHPFRHLLFCSPVLNFPGTLGTAFESLCFLSSLCASLTCLRVCVLSISRGFHVFLGFILLNFNSITLHCKESSSAGFRESVGCNYCSLIAVQPFPVFLVRAQTHHTSANYNTLNAAVCVLIFLLPSLLLCIFVYVSLFHTSSPDVRFPHLSCFCRIDTS